MFRLAVLALILSILALAVVAVTSAVLPARRRDSAEHIRRQEDTMPAPFRTIAYGALILLLMGVVTGVIGGS